VDGRGERGERNGMEWNGRGRERKRRIREEKRA
jgi:hypothetical protein